MHAEEILIKMNETKVGLNEQSRISILKKPPSAKVEFIKINHGASTQEQLNI